MERISLTFHRQPRLGCVLARLPTLPPDLRQALDGMDCCMPAPGGALRFLTWADHDRLAAACPPPPRVMLLTARALDATPRGCLQLPGALAAFAGITNRGDLLLEDDGALWLTAPSGLPPFFQKKQGPP
ncbi:hypothetical protein [Dysosmobacter sp.]|uniref:hypothetical protein n=1 Tax=Dysosmobacter sp. TaxID=2591382 RepID=UPI002A84465F|nr:hypothetical protein [Dysosmobacter sp.]MDY3984170.1 hypothetical protein [Dysosmobacter sp.]